LPGVWPMCHRFTLPEDWRREGGEI
ncbi:uncharacterized protein METZ01_LOCUS143572, partial [marine metagenome]